MNLTKERIVTKKEFSKIAHENCISRRGWRKEQMIKFITEYGDEQAAVEAASAEISTELFLVFRRVARENYIKVDGWMVKQMEKYIAEHKNDKAND